ncbi:MAG TPA: lysylphosphatidylglycerol synthase transmembrane domain-containing protein [Candidatus Acidoferrales bacterium]|nr:lysylphosphatidylglycerol synthase transmembrane domain-containing protein [Candidatus Acidoferrales bacterium]
MPSTTELNEVPQPNAHGAAQAKKTRATVWAIVRLAVGIGLLVYLAKSRPIQFGELAKIFTAWPITLAALALVFLDIFFMSLRLCWLFQPQGLRLPLLRSLDLTLVSSFFVTFLPGAAGGDLAKLFYAAKENKGRRAEIVTTIAFDRAVGLFSILLLPLIFAPLFVPLIRSVPALRVLLALTAALAFAMLGVFLLCLLNQSWMIRAAKGISRVLPVRQLPERVVASIAAYRGRWELLLAALVASLASNLTLIAATALAIFLISPGSLSLKLCLVVPMGDVANSLPLTPGGLGVGEAAFGALFGIAGLQGGAEALLCWRIWRAMVGLAGLAIYLRGMRRAVFS